MRILPALFLALLSHAAAAQPQGIWGERGITRAFAPGGDRLYAADGRGVSVYDVADPAAIARIDVESGDAESVDLALIGNRGLVVATSKGIDHFGVNADGTLDRLLPLEVGGGVSHVAASSTRAIAAARRSLMILEREGSELTLAHQVEFGADIRALEVSGNIAFVAVERIAIYAIDIESGETLNTVAVDALDLAVTGGTLWAVAGMRGLFAIDVATQSVTGSTGTLGYPVTLAAASGSRVYAVQAPDRVHVFDGAKPSDIRHVATVADWVNVIATHGSRVFVAGATVDSEGFTFETGIPVRVYDSAGATVPVQIGEYRDLAGPISGVWTDGSVAYVVDAPYLRVLDISKATEPRELASIVVPDIQDNIRVKNGLALNYGRLYLVLIDVSNPHRPRVLGRWHTQGHAPSFAALARDTAVEANEHSGLHVVDYSDPAAPVQIAGRIMHYHDIVAGDDAAYALQSTTFLTVDLTDRTRVVDRTMMAGQYIQLDTMPPNSAFPHHLALRSESSLTLFSLTEDRFRPAPVRVVPMARTGLMGTSDTSVYIARDGLLHRLDLPAGAAFAPTSMVVTSPMQISVAGEKVVVADRYRLRVFGPDTAPPPAPPMRRRAVGH